MSTTRYYIERETAIPGEWTRETEEPFDQLFLAVDAAKTCFLIIKRKYRVVQITETIVGVYG